ncbi:UV-B-induced protein At3g17800, chloroplastic [Arachis duranensis]|uniref:UV-B-induced protein At3g17800, chloroplastic n=1 Tax=Arachis duranensis TaxID=130453 RepID=A0A6P4DA75_ARADU|nr:UV-B-induced protein At3g17800, chloroplastic [Arachis duranensis]XP_052118312.1 UV-B-induced protein At3g17800, chloroplastic [Arachis duranensis]
MQISGAISDVLVVLPPSASLRLPEFRHLNTCAVSDAKNFISSGFLKSFPSCCNAKHYNELYSFRSRGLVTRASAGSSDNLAHFAPLQLETPVGQLLEQISQTHPHLLLATIDQQLENLQTARDEQKEESSTSSQDPLYKRIAEVKEKEKRTTLEEIMYCSVVNKFLENNISMIPKISATSDPTGRVDFWPNQELKLEAVHSTEAFEMIQSHLSLVLGERLVGPLQTIVQISKIKLGKLYAASIMYGYFLKRVDERYQLERAMGTLPKDFGKANVSFDEPVPPSNQLWDPDSLITIRAFDDVYSDGDYMENEEGKSYRLRSYVMQLDSETLQRLATIRSKEAMSLIEKQTQALFGRPDIRVSEDGSIETPNDEVLSIAFSGLTMLVLEAVAFGSFLWDAENYVELKYPFLNN